jgi:hypothetical protein
MKGFGNAQQLYLPMGLPVEKLTKNPPMSKIISKPSMFKDINGRILVEASCRNKEPHHKLSISRFNNGNCAKFIYL